MVFERKRLETETLGEYLQSIRQYYHLSLEEVSSKSNIKLVFLSWLEQGDYHRLPPEVYVTGFLRQLAQLYNLDSASLILQYKKERDLLLERAAVRAASEPLWRVLLSRITITPALVTVGSAAVLILIALGYVLYQIILINGEPALVLLEPVEGQHVVNSFIRVAGKADPGTTVTVNDQQVFVGSGGSFAATIGLAAGQQELVVTAKNKFNKQSTKRVVVVADSRPSEVPQVLGATLPSLNLHIEALDAVSVTFSADDGQKQTLSFLKGQQQTIEAKEKVILSVSNAGLVKIILNGTMLGVLGPPGEPLIDIPFTHDSVPN